MRPGNSETVTAGIRVRVAAQVVEREARVARAEAAEKEPGRRVESLAAAARRLHSTPGFLAAAEAPDHDCRKVDTDSNGVCSGGSASMEPPPATLPSTSMRPNSSSSRLNLART